MAAPVGIGLRAPHYGALARLRPDLGFLEVHAENFFGGGAPRAWLHRFRADYALSVHGVGLSLGGTDPLDEVHLAALESLVRETQPLLVSEHLSWGSLGGIHANDLLPMPFTAEAVAHLAGRIARVQDRLRREILVENVSAYHRFDSSTLEEAHFVVEVVHRAGCGLLLDVNNVHVNAVNHGFDALRYLDAIPVGMVREMHLAGHHAIDGILVDTHGAAVSPEVWALHAHAARRFAEVPTLVEWDTDIPPLETLLAEAHRARQAMRDAALELVPA
jgi:uncharacterized protein